MACSWSNSSRNGPREESCVVNKPWVPSALLRASWQCSQVRFTLLKGSPKLGQPRSHRAGAAEPLPALGTELEPAQSPQGAGLHCCRGLDTQEIKQQLSVKVFSFGWTFPFFLTSGFCALMSCHPSFTAWHLWKTQQGSPLSPVL